MQTLCPVGCIAQLHCRNAVDPIVIPSISSTNHRSQCTQPNPRPATGSLFGTWHILASIEALPAGTWNDTCKLLTGKLKMGRKGSVKCINWLKCVTLPFCNTINCVNNVQRPPVSPQSRKIQPGGSDGDPKFPNSNLAKTKDIEWP